MLDNISDDIYSLEPALDPIENEGFADKSQLNSLFNKLPEVLQSKVDEKTFVESAENISLDSDSIDLVLAKNVPFSSDEQLNERFSELLRVGNEIRIFPINETNRDSVIRVLDSIQDAIPLEYEFKTTVDTEVKMEDGHKKIVDDVLIIKKTKV